MSRRSVCRKLPRWIGEQVVPVSAFGQCVRQLREFFAGRKQQVADNATALAASDKATHATQHPTAMEEGIDFE